MSSSIWCQSVKLVSCKTFLSLHSPSGWDNDKKIAILHENFTTVRPEDPFEDFITKPPVRKVRKEPRNENVTLICLYVYNMAICSLCF